MHGAPHVCPTYLPARSRAHPLPARQPARHPSLSHPASPPAVSCGCLNACMVAAAIPATCSKPCPPKITRVTVTGDNLFIEVALDAPPKSACSSALMCLPPRSPTRLPACLPRRPRPFSALSSFPPPFPLPCLYRLPLHLPPLASPAPAFSYEQGPVPCDWSSQRQQLQCCCEWSRHRHWRRQGELGWSCTGSMVEA